MKLRTSASDYPRRHAIALGLMLGVSCLAGVAPALRAQEQSDTTISTERVVPHAARRVGPRVDPKSERVAVQLSLMTPGAGQFYAGKPKHGVAVIAAGIGALGLMVPSLVEFLSFGLVGEITNGDLNRMYAGVALGVAAQVYSVAAAPGQVREWNRKHASYTTGPRPPRAVLHVGSRARATNVGVGVHW